MTFVRLVTAPDGPVTAKSCELEAIAVESSHTVCPCADDMRFVPGNCQRISAAVSPIRTPFSELHFAPRTVALRRMLLLLQRVPTNVARRPIEVHAALHNAAPE